MNSLTPPVRPSEGSETLPHDIENVEVRKGLPDQKLERKRTIFFVSFLLICAIILTVPIILRKNVSMMIIDFVRQNHS
jgi:hypothetical protein